MIDHLSLPVSDMVRSQFFDDKVLVTLGYKPILTFDEPGYIAVGYGLPEQNPTFCIGTGNADVPSSIPLVPLIGHHIASSTSTRNAVDRFYQAGLEVGGKDNGPAGLRPHYHPNYYAAFLIDPDGHHIEAVCHTPEDTDS